MVSPRLSIGASDFAALREPGVLLVDKTDLIARVLSDPYQTLLFPRPRRIGKSTNLSMLGYFLGKRASDCSALFQDLAIWREPEARRHFQRYPVISLTFKDVKCATWPECLASIKGLLMDLYGQHSYLLQAEMKPGEAAAFQSLLLRRASGEDCKEALRKLSQHLHAYHGERVVILRQRISSPWSMEELQRWYNGYHFGGQVIYNPWSVLSALGRPQEPLRPYWVNTASDELIRELLFRFGGGEQGEMEALLRGEGVRKVLREDTVLRDIYREPEALWSFLLFTGYLKAEDVQVQVEGSTRSVTTGTLKVPNLEVSSVFANLFDRWLEQGVGGEQRRQQMIQALLGGDLPRFQEHLQRLLLEAASFHDLGGARERMPPEHVYQMFILGLLVSMGPRHRVHANREGGHGRYDVIILPREPGQPATTPRSCARTAPPPYSRWRWPSMASGCWWGTLAPRPRGGGADTCLRT